MWPAQLIDCVELLSNARVFVEACLGAYVRTAILIVQFYFTLTTKEVIILGVRVRLNCALALLILANLIQLEAWRKVLTRIALALSHAEVCV